MIPIYVITNDNHLFLLQGFSYLWNKYADNTTRVTVVGYSNPPFELPPNFEFMSLGPQRPKQEWSDALLDFTDIIPDEQFVLMLEDFWLNNYVDRLVINKLSEHITSNVLRIDLSGNRISYDYRSTGIGVMGYELIESSPSARYQMSYQAAIWNKKNFQKVLKRGENPWESEINGSKRVGNLRVLGTNPKVISYQPVWRSKQGRWQLDRIKPGDLGYIKGRGWLDV